MLATSAVTFWRWLTGQPLPLDAATTAEDRRVWLRHTAKLNIRCEQADEDGESGVYAVVCDISRGGIQIVAPRRFEPGSILNIELTPAQGEAPLAVLACVIRAQPHGESDWAMGCRFSSELEDEQLHAFGAARVRPSTPDPRGWSRFSCEAKAFYQRVNSDDPAHHSARVLNISVSGVALQVDEPIALGELLSIDLHDAAGQPIVTILACVVHVQTDEEGLVLGCNFIRELGDNDLQALI